jgi:hypothetical protein
MTSCAIREGDRAAQSATKSLVDNISVNTDTGFASSVTPASTPETTAAMETNIVDFRRLVIISTLVAQAEAVATATFETGQDAQNTGDQLAERLGETAAEAVESGLRELWRSLRELRFAVVNDVRIRSIQLPELRRVTPARTVPVMLLAYRETGDAESRDELVTATGCVIPPLLRLHRRLRSSAMTEELTLNVDGKVWGGWTDMTINRSLESVAGEFDLTVTAQWSPPALHQTRPVLYGSIGSDRVMTGYIDDFIPSYDAENVSLRVMGRDKTGDLVDSSVVDKSGQWKGQKLEQLAATICKPYGIEVVNETDTGDAFGITLEQGETGFELLDRLAKQRGVLVTSDAYGRLVITRASTQRAGVALTR